MADATITKMIKRHGLNKIKSKHPAIEINLENVKNSEPATLHWNKVAYSKADYSKVGTATIAPTSGGR